MPKKMEVYNYENKWMLNIIIKKNLDEVQCVINFLSNLMKAS